MKDKDIFCKIINGLIPSSRVLEGDDWLAINDIHPQAPTHVLIIPKVHIGSIEELQEQDVPLVGRLILAVHTVAKHLKLADGYRVIINHGEHGGQSVPHLHIHLLGGKPLGASIVSKS